MRTARYVVSSEGIGVPAMASVYGKRSRGLSEGYHCRPQIVIWYSAIWHSVMSRLFCRNLIQCLHTRRISEIDVPDLVFISALCYRNQANPNFLPNLSLSPLFRFCKSSQVACMWCVACYTLTWELESNEMEPSFQITGKITRRHVNVFHHVSSLPDLCKRGQIQFDLIWIVLLNLLKGFQTLEILFSRNMWRHLKISFPCAELPRSFKLQ